jgi:hypothetical protein
MSIKDAWLPAVIGSLVVGAPVLGTADDSARTPKAVEAAKKLMGEVAEAYVKAPAMTDEMTISFIVPGTVGEQSFTSNIRFDGKNAQVEGMMEMFDFYVLDGTMYAISDFTTDAVVSAKLGEHPTETLVKVFGKEMEGFTPLPLLLRLGVSVDKVEAMMGMDLLRNPKIAGHAMIEDDQGMSLHEVLIDGAEKGTMQLYVDPKTKLIMKSIATGQPEDFPGTDTITVTTMHRPSVKTKLDTPIKFDVGDRKIYKTVEDMMMASRGDTRDFSPSIEVGSEAPEFSLLDQDGKTHDLNSYRGQVVVLDWWGVW